MRMPLETCKLHKDYIRSSIASLIPEYSLRTEYKKALTPYLQDELVTNFVIRCVNDIQVLSFRCLIEFALTLHIKLLFELAMFFLWNISCKLTGWTCRMIYCFHAAIKTIFKHFSMALIQFRQVASRISSDFLCFLMTFMSSLLFSVSHLPISDLGFFGLQIISFVVLDSTAVGVPVQIALLLLMIRNIHQALIDD